MGHCEDRRGREQPQQDKIQISKEVLRAGHPQADGDLSLLVLLGLAWQCLFSQGHIYTSGLPWEMLTICSAIQTQWLKKVVNSRISNLPARRLRVLKSSKACNCSSHWSLSLARHLHLMQKATFIHKFSLHVHGGCWQPTYYTQVTQANPVYLTKGVLQHHAGVCRRHSKHLWPTQDHTGR